MDICTELFAKYLKNINLCSLFKILAIDTWSRLEFTYLRPNIGIGEVTITENLMYYIQKFNEIKRINNILIYEATNEPVNGNDLLIYLKFSNGLYYPFVIQAKRLYKDEKYYALRGSKEYNKLQNLKNYAAGIGGLPFYLLYNFISNQVYTNTYCGHNVDIKQYGCSLVTTDNVENICAVINPVKKVNTLSIPLFSSFHFTFALPWMILVCCKWDEKKTEEFISNYKIKIDYNWKGYELKELLSDPTWITKSNGGVKEVINLTNFTSEVFNPRYRIIISSSRSTRAILRRKKVK